MKKQICAKTLMTKLIVILLLAVFLVTANALLLTNAGVSMAEETTDYIANPDFEISSSTSYPKSVKNWTGTAGGSSGNRAPSSSDYIKTGIIDIQATSFDDNRSKYGLNAEDNPGSVSGTNVLMIRNIKPTAYGFKSASFTLKANNSFKISVWVKTHGLAGTAGTDFGAYINLTSSSTLGLGTEEINSFKAINTDGYTDSEHNDYRQYSFYIQTSQVDKTFTLTLSLGNGAANDTTNFTTGWAFYDNVKIETITNSAFEAKTSSETEIKYSFKNKVADTFNGNFTETLNTTPVAEPAKWTPIAFDGAPAADVKGVISLSNASVSAYLENVYKLTTAPSPAGSDDNVLLLNHKDTATVSGYRSEKITLLPHNYYKLSVSLKTSSFEDYDAGVKLAVIPDGQDETAQTALDTSAKTDENGGFNVYSFYITAPYLYPADITLEVQLGDKDAYVKGYAIIDNITLERMTKSDFNSASSADSNSAALSLAQTFSPDVANGGFNEISSNNSDAYPYAPTSWTGYYGGNTILGGTGINIATGNVNSGIVNCEYWDADSMGTANIPSDGSELWAPNVLMINNKSNTSYAYVSSTKSVSANSFAKFTVLVKTEAVNHGAYVALVVDSKTIIARFDKIDTSTLSSPDNDWIPYTFYVSTGYESRSIALVLSLGWGNSYDTDTHSVGYAYFDNAQYKTFTSEKLMKEDMVKLSENEDVTGKINGVNVTGSDFYKYCDMRTLETALDYSADVNEAVFFDGSYAEDIAYNDGDVVYGIVAHDYNSINALEKSNAIMINNINESAYKIAYKNSLSLTGNNYYKMSFKVKTDLTKGDAYIKLANNVLSTDDEDTFTEPQIKINTSGYENEETNNWQEVEMYLKTGADARSVTLEFGAGTKDALAQGYFFIDDILIETSNQNDYEEAEASDTVLKFDFKALEAQDDGSDDEEDNTSDNKTNIFDIKNINWLLIPSIILALALVAAIIAVVVKRVQKKNEGKKKALKKRAKYDRYYGDKKKDVNKDDFESFEE